jgi:ATP-dependent DNA helicase RecG
MPESVLQIAESLVALANGRGGILILPTTQPAVVIERVLRAALRVDPPLMIPLPTTITLPDNPSAAAPDAAPGGTATPEKPGPDLLSERASAGPAVRVEVPPGLPHVYSVDGRYLIRENDANQPLPPGRLRRLMLVRGELTFEDAIIPEATAADLDWKAAEAYAASFGATDARELLIQRGCLRVDGSVDRPTNAGMLLFGTDTAVTQYIRGAFITAVRFAGVEMGDVFTRAEISGALPAQIRRAETFLIDHLRKDVKLTATMQRRERMSIPLEAAREVVVNAVAHRDYSIKGDGIRLYLFADRLEVTSPGTLAGPVTIDNLVEERFSRNSTIVQVLSDMGFIERLGYGIDRILLLMREESLPAPSFKETAGGFRVTLFSEPPAIDPSVSYPGLNINPRQQAALDYLSRHSSITNRQLQELCPDVHPETLRRDLADLVSKNVIERLGEKRGSYYVLGRAVTQVPG